MKKLFCITLSALLIALVGAFAGCSSGEATVNYTLSEDGTYYVLSSVTGNKSALKEYEIPATYSAEEGGAQLPVKEIADSVFYQCTALKKITMPNTLKTIGNLSFAMSGLTEVTIPSSVETIGYSAFGMCSSLINVTIPSNVTSLGDRAFMGCSRLERAEVYASITDLKASTFYNSIVTMGGNVYTDTSLTEVVLSSSIVKISESALAGNAITDIYFTGTEEQWGELYFYTTTTNDKGEVEEKKVEKSVCIPSATKIHFNYTPEN
ncbi:MAG: leucine-rich repeat domain-containing protein [Candidatus Coproplasma sp.]